MIKVVAESGDMLANAGYGEITIVIQQSLPHPGVPQPGYEYWFYLPGEDLADDAWYITGGPAPGQPVVLDTSVVRAFLKSYPTPPAARA